MQQDTICAIATAQGGAIGVIRVSGPEAISITSRIFTPISGKHLVERKLHGGLHKCWLVQLFRWSLH